MRKLTALISVFVLILACCGTAYAENAAEAVSGDFVYFLKEDGSATISAYTGTESDLTIPSELDGHPVTVIGEKAFKGNENLVSVIVPEGVQVIEKLAFSECGSLVSVSLPDGLLSIGDEAFMHSWNLSGLTIPETVTTLGLYVLYECDSVASLRIPDSVITCEGPPVFSMNGTTELIVSPDHPVFELIDGVLFDKVQKKLISYRQADYESVSYSIPEGTEIIGQYAFDCSVLSQISIPGSMKVIEAYAFNSCRSVESFTLPEGLTVLGSKAFCNCDGMVSVNVPDSVTEISNNVFGGCTALSDLRISPDQPVIMLVDGVMFSKDGRQLLWYPPTSAAASYTIPDGTEVITASVFSYAAFSSVVIPDSVVTIEDSAFNHCEQLKEITIPASVTVIGKNVFSRCEQLERVSLPDGITSIENSTFNYCKALKDINIPESVTSIGKIAFRGCESLEALAIPAGVESVGENAFSDCPALTLSIAPGSSVEQYCIDNGINYTVR